MHRAVKKSKSAPPGRSVPDRTHLRLQAWAPALLLAVATLALYWPATHCGFITIDDDLYVTANFHVQQGLSLQNLKWAFIHPVSDNWHPLTMLSHMLDCQLFGLNPWGHHLVNVLLHTANTVLVFLALRSLTGAIWRSWFVAALFGLHPLHVESVAWVSERKDVLSTFFGLLALWFYTRYAKSKIAGLKNNIGNYLTALIFFVLGLMSKPMLVTWPFVLLLLDYWPLERFKHASAWRLVWEKIPFFLLVAVASVATFLVHKYCGDLISVNYLPIGARCENALISYCRQLGKLFWPTDLAIFYPHPGYWPMIEVLAAGISLTGITVFVWVIRKEWPFLLTGWLWFCGTMVPVIGLVQVGGQAIADRHTYIPSLGVFILTIWGMHEISRRLGLPARALFGVGSVALILYFGLAWRQLGYWRDTETLMRHAIAVTQYNYLAHYNLALALENKGQLDDAIPEYQEAIRLKPDYAEAFYHLGNTYNSKGQLDEAIRQYQQAVRFYPAYVDAYYNLGVAFDSKGQLDEAIRQYQEAIQLNPDYAEAHNNLGVDLGGKGRLDEAILQYQAAIRLDPDYTEAHDNLGLAYGNKGQFDQAILQFQQAIRLNPDFAEAHNNLGVALGSKGQLDEAIRQFQEAVRLNPDYAEAHANLTHALEIKK